MTLFWKIKVGLAICMLSVSVYARYQLLNDWTNLHETSYVYHGTWGNLNGEFHKALKSVCVYMCMPPSLFDNAWVKTLPP
jgi:hypothetical protein